MHRVHVKRWYETILCHARSISLHPLRQPLPECIYIGHGMQGEM